MSPQMQSVSSRNQTYRAVKTFALGQTGVTLHRGMSLDFDGILLTLQGYAPMQMPGLRGAIKQGWIVPESEFDEAGFAPPPVSANVRVGRADGGNPMHARNQSRDNLRTAHVDSEEREVESVSRHASGVRTANTSYRRGSDNRAVPGRFVTRIEEQDARVVHGRSFQTPAEQTTNLERVSVYQAIQEANSVKIDAGEGRTREDMIASMDPEEAAEYVATIDARRAAHVPEAYGTPVIGAQALLGSNQVVGRVPTARTIQKEGFVIQNHVGGGVETADLSGLDQARPDQVSKTESEGVMFTNTNGPRKAQPRLATAPQAQAKHPQTKLVSTKQAAPQQVQAKPAPQVSIKGTEDTRRKIAKMMCADFPDLYNFDDTDRKKIARIQADFEDRGDVIQAIFAAENDAMKARLLQEFPEAFA